MKKIYFILVMFLVATIGYSQPLTPTLKYSNAAYAWNTGVHSRDMSLSNDTIYATDKNTKAIHKISTVDGTEFTDRMWANDMFTGFSITHDDVGNSYVTSSAWGMTNNIQGTLTVGNTSTYANTALSGTGRIDFVEAFGDFSSSALLAGASTNSDVISVWQITNGAFVNAAAPVVFNNPRGGDVGVGADIKWMDGTRILVTGQSLTPSIVTLDLSNGTASRTLVGTATYPVGGSGYFEWEGTPYVVLPTDGLGQFTVLDITDPALPDPVAVNTTKIGETLNNSYHVGFETQVEGNVVTIHVWSPNNGLAGFELDMTTLGIEDVIDKTSVLRTSSGITVTFEGEGAIELYNINGRLIDKANAYNSYSRDLERGAYIIRVNGKAVKFVR